jgi:hypothetical protein
MVVALVEPAPTPSMLVSAVEVKSMLVVAILIVSVPVLP